MTAYFKSFVAIALAISIISGCRGIEMDQRQGIGNKYSFTIDDNTRAVIGDENVKWTEGDKVGMFVGSFKGSADVDVSTSPKTVVLYSESAIPAGTKAYAYYPYDPETAGDGPEKVSIFLSNTQNGYQSSAMPLAGIPFDVKEEIGTEDTERNGRIRFLNLGSLINFKIWSSEFKYRSETVKSVRLDASVPIAGVGYIDLTAVSEDDEGTLKVVTDAKNVPTNSVRVDEKVKVSVDKIDAKPIKMVVFPGTFKATLTVITDAAEYTKEIPEFTFGRSHSRTFFVDLAKAKRSEDETLTNLKVDELKLKTARGLSLSVSRILGVILILGVVTTLLLVLAFGVVLVVGDLIHSYGGAAFIVAGVLAVILGVLLLLRERLFRNSFVPLFVKLFFPEDDGEEV